jgi:hypothetical protein
MENHPCSAEFQFHRSGSLGAASTLCARLILCIMVIGCRSGLLTTVEYMRSGSSSILLPHHLHPQSITWCMQIHPQHPLILTTSTTTLGTGIRTKKSSYVVRFHEQQSAYYKTLDSMICPYHIRIHPVSQGGCQMDTELREQSHVPVLKGKHVCRSFRLELRSYFSGPT